MTCILLNTCNEKVSILHYLMYCRGAYASCPHFKKLELKTPSEWSRFLAKQKEQPATSEAFGRPEGQAIHTFVSKRGKRYHIVRRKGRYYIDAEGGTCMRVKTLWRRLSRLFSEHGNSIPASELRSKMPGGVAYALLDYLKSRGKVVKTKKDGRICWEWIGGELKLDLL